MQMTDCLPCPFNLMGRSKSTERKPRQTRGEHSNSSTEGQEKLHTVTLKSPQNPVVLSFFMIGTVSVTDSLVATVFNEAILTNLPESASNLGLMAWTTLTSYTWESFMIFLMHAAILLVKNSHLHHQSRNLLNSSAWDFPDTCDWSTNRNRENWWMRGLCVDTDNVMLPLCLTLFF